MHTCVCAYCHNPFIVRPQVKNPKACSKAGCQTKRQAANEAAWHERNVERYGPQYHRDKRKKRHNLLKTAADSIVRCLKIGSAMTKVTFMMEVLAEVLHRFFIGMGIRRLNKLWNH